MAESDNSDENTLLITREFDAPRSLVFEAWTTAEHLEKWFGPIGFTTSCAIDFRTGGAVRITLRGHGIVSTIHGVYREIVRPERIVLAVRFDDIPDHEMVQTITFAEAGGKTTLTMRQVLPSWDRVSPAHQELLRPRARGAREGWTQTLQHLADYLGRQR